MAKFSKFSQCQWKRAGGSVRRRVVYRTPEAAHQLGQSGGSSPRLMW